MPGALRIDKAAHELMNFRPVKEIAIGGYSVFYHEEHLYSVRHIKNGMVCLVYAYSPQEAVNMVRNGEKDNVRIDSDQSKRSKCFCGAAS